MTSDANELKRLAEVQKNLYTVEHLLSSHQMKHDQLTDETLSFSNDLICELHLLSLIRAQILGNKIICSNNILGAQILRGLSFSTLEYCPSFFDPNVLNHYITFISLLRSNLDVLAKCFYYYSFKNPKKVLKSASLFLTIFQMGWCKEEDNLMLLCLKNIAELQFSNKQYIPFEAEKDVLKPPRFSPENILAKLNPLASFVTTYLFNGASFSYLQCALDHIINILHSLSSLKNLRNLFSTNGKGGFAPVKYWKVICENALLCFKSLIRCLELLPPSVSELFKFIRQSENGNEKCILLFFESFVNRALDNPAILGLLPWHPGNAEWSPTRDIASVFRSKYSKYSISSYHDCFNVYQSPLTNLLSSIPTYEEIDFDLFLDALTNKNTFHNGLISECELLNINPAFPKELVITAKDLCFLQSAALSLTEEQCDNQNLRKIIKLLGDVPTKNPKINEHFKIVLLRQKEITTAAKAFKNKSLFTSDEVKIVNTQNYSFENYFCDIIANFPSFKDLLKSLKPKNTKEFLITIRTLSPHFLPEKLLSQADSLFYYTINGIKTISEILPELETIINQRNVIAMNSADKTSSLRIQHQRITSSLVAVKKMRINVQGYILSFVARYLNQSDLNYQFTLAMSKSINFLTDIETFHQSVTNIKEATNKILSPFKIQPFQSSIIFRILFFQMVGHVTLNRFMISYPLIWKKSTIISKIIEDNRDKILNDILNGWKDSFHLREKYITRTIDLLGHINPNSGISMILYYVVEAIDILTELENNIEDFNFNKCIELVLISSKTKHICFGVSKFIEQFLLQNSFLDKLLTNSEMKHLGIFCSSVSLVLDICKKYDKRIQTWE